MASEDTITRIPAWKRIGLKLKKVQDSAEQRPAESHPASAFKENLTVEAKPFLNQPQKRPSSEGHANSLSKRNKLSGSVESDGAGPRRDHRTLPELQQPNQARSWASKGFVGSRSIAEAADVVGKTANRIVFDDSDEQVEPENTKTVEGQSGKPKKSQRASLRKSVSFTSDTKADDSFSAPVLSQGRAGQSNDREQTEFQKTESPAKALKAEKKKSKKKSKSTLVEPAFNLDTGETAKRDAQEKSVPATEAPIYVRYLEQFYNDRENWKFNKKHQKDLFKNLFRLNQIPCQHNGALVKYVAGLNGLARERIAQQAEEVLKSIWDKEEHTGEDMSIESPEARREAYYSALSRHIDRYMAAGIRRDEYIDTQIDDMRIEKERGERAEAILKQALPNQLCRSSAAENLLTMTPGPNAVTTGNGAPSQRQNQASKPPRRKRKARTDVSTSSSSSSSSDSGSESD